MRKISSMNLFEPLRSFKFQVRSFDRSARLFLAATILNGIVFSAWSLFFNFFILERGFERDYLGLVNAMPSIAGLLLGIPIGALSDRLGYKRAMLLGVVLAVVCMGLEVTVLDPNLILVMAFLGGTANMLYFISQAPFMMRISQVENRTLLFSLSFGLSTLAGAAGSLFAGQLPGLFGELLNVAPRSAAAYQAVLLVSVALSALTLVPLLMIRETIAAQPASSRAEKSPAFWQVVLRPLTLRLALPNMLIGLGAAILIPYMNLFFAERFALPDSGLGVLFSLSALLTGLGSVVGPRLAVRLGGKVRAVVFTQGTSLVFLMLVGFAPSLWMAETGFLLRGALMNMAVPLYHAFAMERIREGEQGTANSVIELAWQVGWAVGPYVSGLVQEAYGFTPLFLATGTLYALSIGLTWMFFGRLEGRAVDTEGVYVEDIVAG
ncbi:MAG TPA: MFS transporter [Anaerolineales bacterium]|nr:MFS transporter [Anaerolineales bacterium]